MTLDVITSRDGLFLCPSASIEAKVSFKGGLTASSNRETGVEWLTRANALFGGPKLNNHGLEY